jgi:hypothetical protein
MNSAQKDAFRKRQIEKSPISASVATVGETAIFTHTHQQRSKGRFMEKAKSKKASSQTTLVGSRPPDPCPQARKSSRGAVPQPIDQPLNATRTPG